MCYESLLDERAREQSVASLLRTERWDAFVNGLEAALVVVALLLWQGTPPVLLAGAALGAVVLGYVLHQLVLVAGIGVVRLRSGPAARSSAGGT